MYSPGARVGLTLADDRLACTFPPSLFWPTRPPARLAACDASRRGGVEDQATVLALPGRPPAVRPRTFTLVSFRLRTLPVELMVSEQPRIVARLVDGQVGLMVFRLPSRVVAKLAMPVQVTPFRSISTGAPAPVPIS